MNEGMKESENVSKESRESNEPGPRIERSRRLNGIYRGPP